MLRTSSFKSLNFQATDIEVNDQGKVWAIWGFNIFTHRVALWNIPELKAYNEPSEVDALVSLLICGLV